MPLIMYHLPGQQLDELLVDELSKLLLSFLPVHDNMGKHKNLITDQFRALKAYVSANNSCYKDFSHKYDNMYHRKLVGPSTDDYRQ